MWTKGWVVGVVVAAVLVAAAASAQVELEAISPPDINGAWVWVNQAGNSNLVTLTNGGNYCTGGSNPGAACTVTTQCPGGACVAPFPRFRIIGQDGASANFSMDSEVDGVVGGVHSWSRTCTMCAGGSNVGAVCSVSSQCPSSTCSATTGCLNGHHVGGWTWTVRDLGACVGGSNNNALCRTATQCPGGACGNACVGGSNNLNSCSGASACPGGACTGGGNLMFIADMVVEVDDVAPLRPNYYPGTLLFQLGNNSGAGQPTAMLELHDYLNAVVFPRHTNFFQVGLDSTGTMVNRGGGTLPLPTACGTTPARAGRDNAGRVTMGSGTVNSCTVGFSATKTNIPSCTVGPTTAAIPISWSESTSALTITSTANMAGITLRFLCEDI